MKQKKPSQSLYEFRSRRIKRSFAFESRNLSGPEDAVKLLHCLTSELDREHFYALFVSVRGKLVGYETIAVGGMAGVEVHPREVFRGALVAGAFAIILAHNHPSGDPSPSDEDRALTQRLHKAGEIVGIPVYDHIIVGGGRMYSFAQQGGL